jgi:exonuclease SbcD
MFKFVHAADIHLDSPLHKLDDYEGAPVEELRHATRRALENMVDLAIAEDVTFVLIAGDLYDGDWKDYNTGLCFISQMSKLREAHIPVYIVAGNHDAQSKITKTLRLPEGVRLFTDEKPETFILDNVGVALHGQSFRSPAIKKNLAAKYPSALSGHFNIGVLHTCATGREGHEPYAPCSMGDLQSKGYDYWALGHVHQREVVLEDPLAVFPGNIQGRHVKETGPKGCMLVSIDDRGRAAANFRPLDVIRWFRLQLDVSGKDTAYDVIDATIASLQEILEQNDSMPIAARVEVTGACPAHDELVSDPERWTNEIRSAAVDAGGGAIWIEKVKLRTEPPQDMKSLERAGGPVAEMLRYLDEVQADPSRLRELAGVLDELDKKLPREVREGDEGLLLDDEQWLAGILGQVRPMLIRRLLSKGEAE